MKKIILASTSPRRRDILEITNLDYSVVPSKYEEDLTLKMPPKELVEFLAQQKGLDVFKKYPNSLIISGDTIVEIDGVILGKAKDRDANFEMLQLLSGKTHRVLSAIMIKDSGKEVINTTISFVTFETLTEERINQYLDTNESIGTCAGGYFVQKLSAEFIKETRGDYFGILGMSYQLLVEGLKDFGIDVIKLNKK